MIAQADLFDVPFCGEIDHPGECINDSRLVDYTDCPTTPDQRRIEEFLETLDLTDRTLLHVGIGNSSLARRLSGRCQWIEGLTVSRRECQKGLSLQLPNYTVECASKYSNSLAGVCRRRYDIIVDNNPASFACCGFHLLVMFCTYRSLLKDGGVILTDRQGMEWAARDPRWRMTWDDWQKIGRRLGMEAVNLNGSVWALVRPLAAAASEGT